MLGGGLSVVCKCICVSAKHININSKTVLHNHVKIQSSGEFTGITPLEHLVIIIWTLSHVFFFVLFYPAAVNLYQNYLSIGRIHINTYTVYFCNNFWSESEIWGHKMTSFLLLTKGQGSTVAEEASCPSVNSALYRMGPPLGRGWLLWSAFPTSEHQRTTVSKDTKNIHQVSANVHKTLKCNVLMQTV